MSNLKVLRILRDPVGWTVDGDKYPRSYIDKESAIQRAEVLARQLPSCQVVILDERGEIEEERRYG